MTEDLQYAGGIFVFVVGLLIVLAAGVAVAIKMMRDALEAATVAGNVVASNISVDPGKIIAELLKNPMTLGVIVGALVIWLGRVMMEGGTWLWFLTLPDPKPDAAGALAAGLGAVLTAL